MSFQNLNATDEKGWDALIIESHSFNGAYCSMGKIARELCESANNSAYANRIDDLLEDVRLAFHRSRPADAQAVEIHFNTTKEEFKAQIEDLPEGLRGDLKLSYDTVWIHESPQVSFLQGSDNSVITRRHLDYQVDMLEDVARKYLETPQWRSETLEWALINSLMYAETLAYLETIPTLWATISGFGSKVGISWWKTSLVSLLSLGWEGVKLIATSALAWGLSDGDRAAAAIIFIAITASRWLYPTKKRREKDRQIRLADSMIGTHALAKNRSFNSGVVRQSAYHSTNLGAVFSDCVFHLLDRRLST